MGVSFLGVPAAAYPVAYGDLRFDFVAPGREPLMWCLIAFCLTFFVTRSITRYIRATAGRPGPRKWWQPHNISVSSKAGTQSGGGGGLHIHHAGFGVILVLMSGVAMVTLATDGTDSQFTAAAIFFGIGAALVLDEFALILHLQDVYWSQDGRTSVDAVFAAVAVAGLLVLGFNPLSFFDIGIWRDNDSDIARISVIALAVLTLALAVVVLLKGKMWTGLLGMFTTPLLFVGAIRLSRPHAPWARWHYTGRATQNASLDGAGALSASALRPGESVAAARHRRRTALSRRQRGRCRTRPPRCTPHLPRVSRRLMRSRPRPAGSGAMRYFYDTEFIDNGRIIDLISIGVVADDGREFYAVSTEFDPESAGRWVRTHVLPKLPSPSSQLWRSRRADPGGPGGLLRYRR